MFTMPFHHPARDYATILEEDQEAILLADKILLMSNGPHAKIAEIVEVTMPRDRTRAGIHHDPQYYRIRNHLVDFLVNRSKTYAMPPHIYFICGW